jgi:hypothetical protein
MSEYLFDIATGSDEYTVTITDEGTGAEVLVETADTAENEVTFTPFVPVETDPVFTAWLDTDPLDDFVESDDSRLTDDRTPTSHGNDKHTSTYITAGDIPAIPADISELTDTTGLLFNGNFPDYLYMADDPNKDTIGDWRHYADASGYYIQYCTVGNAVKGSGTWLTKFTIQV